MACGGFLTAVKKHPIAALKTKVQSVVGYMRLYCRVIRIILIEILSAVSAEPDWGIRTLLTIRHLLSSLIP